jgi:DNA-binding response OmpR family regulator
MYGEYLTAVGFDAITTDNADDALELAGRCEVIVTGIRLRGQADGIDLVRRIRHRRDLAGKPIVVLTACTFEPDRQRAHDAGCDLFLPKPCLPAMLARELRRLMPGRPLKASFQRRRLQRGRKTG